MIKEFILKKMYLKNLEEKEHNIFRASSSGSCTRKLAYTYHKFKSDNQIAYELASDKVQFINDHKALGRSELVFELGHTIEKQLVDILQGELKDTQKEVKLEFEGFEISGHIDGIYTDINGLEWLVDIKSTNDLSFKRYANKGIIDDKYKYQAHCYMHALKIPRFCFLYYNKNTSHLCECFLYYDKEIIDNIINKYSKIITSKPDKLPDKDFDVMNKTNGWNCTYCSFFYQCYNNMTLEVVNGKPKAVLITE